MDPRERISRELLVLRCQEGDADAFEELVGQWQERLWRHAWRLTGEENAAWDALQEAWIAIAKGIRRLDEPAMFPAWAYQIVSHKCRDWIRREQRGRAVAQTYAALSQADDEQAALTQEQYADLKEAMDLLNGPDRAILILRYEEGFDTAQAAAILGVPEGTVKSRLFYARQRLRSFLEDSHHD
jgi:RNA polymerase sigma-70 factor (ECF subfamily)